MLKQNNISPGRNHANRWYTNGDGVAGSTCLFFYLYLPLGYYIGGLGPNLNLDCNFTNSDNKITG